MEAIEAFEAIAFWGEQGTCSRAIFCSNTSLASALCKPADFLQLNPKVVFRVLTNYMNAI